MDADLWLSTKKEEEDPGNPVIRAYGATMSNTHATSDRKIRSQDDVDIQLHEFKVRFI